MRRFTEKPTESVFFEFASEWLDTLAEDFEKAWNLLFHEKDCEMTLEHFANLIQTYEDLDLLPNTPFRVTRLKNKSQAINIDSEESSSAAVSLPLNGEISDLIAELDVIKISDGYAVHLYSLHVM